MNRRVPGLVAVAVVVALSSCANDDTTTPSAATDPVTTSTAIVPPLARGDEYVALGSSIASGFGISVQTTACGRSSRNYPNLIAARYGLALVDVTCGLAGIPNVIDTPQGDNAPQLTAVTPDTKLITVTVGGNDIGYNATALKCGDPQTACSAPADLDSALATARVDLGRMLAAIHAAAPAAIVVFVTYPREVPEGNCPELSYTDQDADVVRSMGEMLQAMFVDVAQNDDVVFVDPYAASGDHTGCAPPDERWTAGYVPDDGFAYHPTVLGHEAMAQMIADALQR